MRTLVIGDIHGGKKAFQQCLLRSDFNINKDKLIFLGDYVDGWSESAELIQFLIELSNNATEKPIFLRGNHDKWCQDWLLEGKSLLNWTQQGGQSTINSYIKTGYLTSDIHKEFFKNLLDYYIDEENRGFVHGGFTSAMGLGYEIYNADYYWDRDLWELALMQNDRTHYGGNLPIFRRFEKHKEIYIGHTSTIFNTVKPHLKEYNHPQQEVKNGSITIPMNRCNIWNIDTGCGYKGKLTILDIDTKEFWQSDFINTLYSDEKGR